MLATSQDGNGTCRRPAADFGNGLNEVFPLTSTTVRTTSMTPWSRSSASHPQPGGLTPAQPCAGRGCHDPSVTVRHSGHQP